MRAVILAAGMGKRLEDVLNGKPKPLFEIGGKSIIEYSLESLAKTELSEVSVVLGFRGEKIKRKLGKKFKKLRINYLWNNSYETSGSMHSFYSALQKPEDCIVLDGDIVYDSQIIPELIKHDKENAVVLTECCGGGDEVYVVLDKNKKVRYLGKSLPSNKTIFEFTGISKFSKRFVDEMFCLHEKNIKKQNNAEYYEDCAYSTSKNVPWFGLIRMNLAWSELDKKEDIPRINKTLKSMGYVY